METQTSSPPLGVAKACTCCGALHSPEAWAQLLYRGIQLSADESGSYQLELRDCPCGSTLGIERQTS